MGVIRKEALVKNNLSQTVGSQYSEKQRPGNKVHVKLIPRSDVGASAQSLISFYLRRSVIAAAPTRLGVIRTAYVAFTCDKR